jgi:hypothetical protein
MATHRVTHDTPTPNPVSTNICSSFSAQLGAPVTFTGVNGIQTVSQVPGQMWPFSTPSPMTVPNPGNIHIKSTGLTLGTTYPFNVSQTCFDEVQKGVTIIT